MLETARRLQEEQRKRNKAEFGEEGKYCRVFDDIKDILRDHVTCLQGNKLV